MFSRKGLAPFTPARLAGTELTQPSADVTQKTVSSAHTTPLPSKNHQRKKSRFEAIRDSLSRLIRRSTRSEPAPEILDFSFQFPSIPPISSLPNHVTRMAPRGSSPMSSSNVSSRASSRSSDELRAEMRRLVPPSDIPHASYQVATGKFWPRGDTLDRRSAHSRNSSKSSSSSFVSTNGSCALETVPELTPSKSDSHFDTTSTHVAVNFAVSNPTAEEDESDESSEVRKLGEVKHERSLFGPLDVDSSCFSFGSNTFNQLPDVVWTTTTKNDPMLLNNVIANADSVFCGDPSVLNPAVYEPCAAELHAILKKKEKEERKARVKKMEDDRKWAETTQVASNFADGLQELNEQKSRERAAYLDAVRKERKAAQEALKMELQRRMGPAAAEQWCEGNAVTESLKTSPGVPSKYGLLSSLIKSMREQQGEVADDDNDSAWETCDNSPVSINEQTGLPGSTLADLAAEIEEQKPNSNINHVDSGCAVEDDEEMDDGCAIECDEDDDCAIESCSTVCVNARGRRYF